MSKIKKQLVSGTLYLSVAKYSGILINVIVISILARILIPAEFAIVAIISVISNFFVLFSDFGIASAIVQNQNLNKSDLNNIFSFCCYFGIILVLIFYSSSFLLEIIYKDHQIKQLAQILTIQVFFSSLNIVPNALILKLKNFKFIAIRSVIVHIFTGTIAILGAITGLGIYSLLINPIGSIVMIFIFNIIKTNYLKIIIIPSFSSLKKVLNYSLFNLGYNVINYTSRNIDKLILGKLMPFEQLGFYEKSYSLMMMPVQNIIAVINPVIHPVLSSFQDDESIIYSYFRRCTSLFAWIGFPISVILYAYGHLIIHIILGNNWDAAIPVFKIFSLSIGIQLVYSLQGPFFLIRNAPNIMMYCGIVTMILNILSLFLGIYIFKSIEGVALMIDFSYILTLVITFYYLLKKCFSNYNITFYLLSFVFPISISVLYLIIFAIIKSLIFNTLISYILQGTVLIILIYISYRQIKFLLKK